MAGLGIAHYLGAVEPRGALALLALAAQGPVVNHRKLVQVLSACVTM